MGNCLCCCRKKDDYYEVRLPSSSWLRTPDTVSFPSSVHIRFSLRGTSSDFICHVPDKSYKQGRNICHDKSSTPKNKSNERKAVPETSNTEKQDAAIVVTKVDVDCTGSEYDQGSAINRVEVNNTHVSKCDLSSGTEETVSKNENECPLEKTHDELIGTVSNGDLSSGDGEKVNEAENESLIEKLPVKLNNTSDDKDCLSIGRVEIASDARSEGLLENEIENFTSEMIKHGEVRHCQQE